MRARSAEALPAWRRSACRPPPAAPRHGPPGTRPGDLPGRRFAVPAWATGSVIDGIVTMTRLAVAAPTGLNPSRWRGHVSTLPPSEPADGRADHRSGGQSEGESAHAKLPFPRIRPRPAGPHRPILSWLRSCPRPPYRVPPAARRPAGRGCRSSRSRLGPGLHGGGQTDPAAGADSGRCPALPSGSSAAGRGADACRARARGSVSRGSTRSERPGADEQRAAGERRHCRAVLLRHVPSAGSP